MKKKIESQNPELSTHLLTEPLPMSPKDDKTEELRKYCIERAELITEGLTVEALIRIADKLYQYIITGEVKEKTP